VQFSSTNTFELDTQYVTLSHCWGRRPIIRLTADSQSRFELRLPFHGLPKTFKEAIIATRNLLTDFNIRYIWIDSLCIIQDSRQDWQAESASMGRIYENSFLTLAATAGVDGETGLFFERNPLSLRPCEVKIDWKRAHGSIFECENRMGWNSSVGRSPLVQRSWVLQERLLSRRALYFTPNQLF
jgi:Heterokaryon incompatibility protein (HET)